MRSKAPLALMEQMVMLLVFALAAALCVQSFAKSDALSQRGEARDRAVTVCQSAAEVIRSCGGEPAHALSGAAERLGCHYDQGLLWADYDENWNSGAGDAYRLTAQGVPSETPGLYAACVAVDCGGETLFEITVAWQEVSAGE